jgi:hypothetical protein
MTARSIGNQRPAKTCLHCGKGFTCKTKLSHAQREATVFCSIDCSHKHRATGGVRYTRLYAIWIGIKTRSFNENDHAFRTCGALGITICEEWRDDFAAFAQYVSPDPGSEYQLGRIDNNAGSQPGNVRWETRSQVARDRRSTHWVHYKGERLSLVEACERAGLFGRVLYNRTRLRLTRYAWPSDRALRS